MKFVFSSKYAIQDSVCAPLPSLVSKPRSQRKNRGWLTAQPVVRLGPQVMKSVEDAHELGTSAGLIHGQGEALIQQER